MLIICASMAFICASSFSSFRNHLKLPLCVSLAISESPDVYMISVRNIYKMLSKDFVFGSEQRALAAMIIFENENPENWQKTAERTCEIYRKMKREHPFLASQQDLATAALMAMRPEEGDDEFIEEMEKCYSLLTDRFVFSADVARRACAIMALDPKHSAEEKCRRFNELYDALKKNKLRLGLDEQLAVLAVLVNLDYSDEKAVEDVRKYDAFLHKQRGCGDFLMGPHLRRMYAITLSTIDSARSEGNAEAISSSTSAVIAILIQIEIALAISIAASSAASSASSSSSH